MKLGTLREGGRDGTLVVVRRDGAVFSRATGVASTLQAALDEWNHVAPALEKIAAQLEDGTRAGEPVKPRAFAAPLPRAYEWIDASAYLPHVRRVRQARGAEMPPNLLTDPLVYQGGSGVLAAPMDPLSVNDDNDGLDFEAEIAVILGDVPRGTTAQEAPHAVKLVCLANDVTMRNLVPAELAKGFGFLQSKPPTAFAPFAVTPGELGDAWNNGRLHLPVFVTWNGDSVGRCDAAQMHFSFHDLVAHIARTRPLTAGTILGSGTVSNEASDLGVCCLAEKRALELIAGAKATTRYLRPGDIVRIEILDGQARSVFGLIDQTVQQGQDLIEARSS